MPARLLREVWDSGTGRTGLLLLALVVLMALLGPLISFYPPNEQTVFSLKSPSLSHWLGTNHVGQDIWTRLVYGARTSLLVGFSVSCIAVTLGVAVGLSAALVGGFYDRVVMRLVDAFIVLPAVILLVVVAAYLRPSLWVLVLMLSLLGWQGGARIVRAQALSLRERLHIDAARAFGAGHLYLGLRHLLPELFPILVVELIYGVRRAVFMEAGLAFLGISDPTAVSWGMMMRDALEFSFLDVWRWWLIPTGVALSLTILSVTFIGHALEPTLEPRLRSAESA